MGKIFSSSERVIFWLGKPTAEATSLLESLAELETNGNQSRRRIRSYAEPVLEQQMISSVLRQRQLEGLQVLLRRPWFRRVWILPEVANARSAIVCSETWSISADIFARAPLLLGLGTETHVQAVLDIMPGSTRIDSWWNRERDLLNLVTKFSASEATDARDMVFALLDISSEPSDARFLRPDYSKPVQEVVHDMVRYWLKLSSNSIKIVLHCLSNFRAIHTTFLVQPKRAKAAEEGEKETIRLPVSSKALLVPVRNILECIKDPDWFLLEHYRDDVSCDEHTLYSELEILRLSNDTGVTSSYGLDGHTLQILSWKSSDQNVMLLIVTDMENALMVARIHNGRQTFRFLTDRSTEDKQALLNTILIAASRRNHKSTVEFSLPEGANINGQDIRDRFALYEASLAGHENIVQMLLDRGADVNIYSATRSPALLAATSGGHEKIVQILLDNGANTSVKGEFDALYTAMYCGHEGVVQMLLDRGANVDFKEERLHNVLYTATYNGIPKIVQLLIDNGADVNVPLKHDRSALQWALQLSHHPAFGRDYDMVMQILLDNGANANIQDEDHRNILRAAARAGRGCVVEMLLNHGADVNASGVCLGNAPLSASKYGQERIVRILLDRGADVNSRGGCPDNALQVALEHGHKNIAQLLREYGAVEHSEIIDDSI